MIGDANPLLHVNPSAINAGLLIIRLSLATVFFAHGINHIFGGGKIAGTARWFESLGMRPGKLHAWTASLSEIAAGVSFLCGFLMPLGAAAVIGVMLVAFITNHAKNGFFIFRPGEGYEYVMTLTLVALGMSALGPGRWSIDAHVRYLDHGLGWRGFLIAFIAGVGGCLLLLAGFWRPGRPAQAAAATSGGGDDSGGGAGEGDAGGDA